MVSAFFAALRQLRDPPIKRVIRSVALWTAAAFGMLGWALWAAIAGLDFASGLGFIPFDWLRDALIALAVLIGGLVFFALFWLLFVAIVHLVSSFYIERVVAAVEARHYPHLGAARPLKPLATLAVTVRFLGVLVLLNLLAAVVYWIPIVGLVAFYLLNGYLFGREYFELIATRRLDRGAMGALRRDHPGRLLAAGLIIALLFSLPLINLVAPIVAAAAMVHVYHAMAGASAQDSLAG